MSAPELSRRLILQERVRSADGAGGQTGGWSDLGTLWAEVKPRRGREQAVGDRERSSVPVSVTVRAASPGAASRPRPDQRFADGPRLYGILSVTEQGPMGRYLVCACVEGFEQ
ncbi:MAG: phage head closure protein [Pseudomonadota bacterium]